MLVTKCDICNKETGEEYVSASDGYFPKIQACYDCGSPIVKFLKKHKIIDKKTNGKK